MPSSPQPLTTPIEAPLDTTVAIEAPEQLRFRFRLAGPAQRGIAQLIDLLVAFVAFAVTVIVIGLVAVPFGVIFDAGTAAVRASEGLVLVAVFAAEWGYFALFEGFWRGQTPGKRWMSLRVVKAGGEPIGFVDAVLRNLLRWADFLPFAYGAGVTCMLIDGRFRRLGDLVAGTMVVLDDRVQLTAPFDIAPPTPDEERALPARVVLDAEELRTLEMFLRRVPSLGTALANELASDAAAMLGRKHGVTHRDPSRMLALLYLRATRAPSKPNARLAA